MNESSFLSQLQQRTQQVKITLANLEAEKTRIEGLIARLQPLVPHYDALLDAERAIAEARITLEEAQTPPEHLREPYAGSAPAGESLRRASESTWNG